jgi:hypothetical protein
MYVSYYIPYYVGYANSKIINTAFVINYTVGPQCKML